MNNSEQDTLNIDEKITRDQWIQHEAWRERRDERDNQTIIMLQNLALWTAFQVCEGGK